MIAVGRQRREESERGGGEWIGFVEGGGRPYLRRRYCSDPRRRVGAVETATSLGHVRVEDSERGGTGD